MKRRESALEKAAKKRARMEKAVLKKKKQAMLEHKHHRKAKPRVKKAVNAAEQDEEDLRFLEHALGIKRGKPLPADFREDGDDLYDLLESLRSDSEISGDENAEDDPEYVPPDELLPGVAEKEREEEAKDAEGEGGDVVVTEEMLKDAMAAAPLTETSKKEDKKKESKKTAAKKKQEEKKVSKKTEDDDDDDDDGDDDAGDDDDDEGALDDMNEAELRKKRAEEREEVLKSTAGKAALRLVKSAVNKLCESNLESIFNQLNEMLLQYALPVVNEALSKCVLESCVLSGSSGGTSQIIVECALIALLNAVVGTEVGGLVLEKVAEHYTQAEEEDKPVLATTMGTVLAHLYNFNVVGCTLVYDFIRKLVSSFGSTDIEVLLTLLKQAGPQLRHDDPSSLKDIVLSVQSQARAVTAGADGESSFSARVQFMLDTIYELKNNRQAETPELLLVQRLRKVAHKIVEKKGVTLGTNEIRTSWEDLSSADPKGRWWAVGSAYATVEITPGHAGSSATGAGSSQSLLKSAGLELDAKLMALAKKHRMNTDTKRAIFAIILSGEDYIDTFQKLMKLGLKGSAQRDIVSVLLYLCGREKHYNPYYEHVAQQLCSLGHNMCFTFQTTFWDTFKPYSTAQQTAPSLAQGREASNLAQLLASLISAGYISLMVLKPVPFESLNTTGVLFFRVMFTHLLTDNDESTVERVFQRLAVSHGVAAGQRRTTEADATVIRLKEGISLFFLQAFRSITIYKHEEEQEKNQKKLLKQRVALANGILVDSVSSDMF